MPDVTHKADPSSPGGSSSPGAGVSPRRVVEQLDEAACLELLSTWADRPPDLQQPVRGRWRLPSEYKMQDGSIVFRTYRVTFTRGGLAHWYRAGRVPGRRGGRTRSIRKRTRGGWC